MADTDKRGKIAAAKKRLKQFQSTKNHDGISENNGNHASKKKKANKLTVENGHVDVANGQAVQQLSDVEESRVINESVSNETTSVSDQGPQGTTSIQTSQSFVSSPHHGAAVYSHGVTKSTERLHQLSRQINGLLSSSESYVVPTPSAAFPEQNANVSDLENRSTELADILDRQSKTNEDLAHQIQSLKHQNLKLKSSLDEERRLNEERIKRDVTSIKEQLQVHIQTIGILVAEKTELQSSLNQCQKLAEARLEEIEELSGRLKASRQRVSDLDRQVSDAQSELKKQTNSNKDMIKDVDRLKLEMYKLNKSLQDYMQQNSELQGKLQKKVSELGLKEDQYLSVQGKLEMAELHVKQLTNTSNNTLSDEATQQMEVLIREKSEMQSCLGDLEKKVNTLSTERDHLINQYQQYADQMTSQSTQLQVQVVDLKEEKEKLISRQQELEEYLKSLEESHGKSDAMNADSENRMKQLEGNLGYLQEQLSSLSAKYNEQINDNNQLSKLVAEKEAALVSAEACKERVDESSFDKKKLLDEMQNDKASLSRAIAQNKELKSQLAELQSGFVTISHQNMEIMTKLTSEEHANSEHVAKVDQQEQEMKELRELLLNKEHECAQVDDRMRHYDAQSRLVESLQQQLLLAQGDLLQSNEDLTLDNSSVREMDTSTRQLILDHDNAVSQLRDEQNIRHDVEVKLSKLEHSLLNDTPRGDSVSVQQFSALQDAMKQIESKYTHAMRARAELSDDNERLEHLIMQLQGETDTIGEYITLYQHQRSVMKQKEEEKDTYISSLAQDRLDMQNKLAQLNQLIGQLLNERQQHSILSEELPKKVVRSMLETSSAMEEDTQFGKNIDSSSIEDWPDYASTESENSEAYHERLNAVDLSNDVQKEETAHKIRSLINEIGQSRLVESTISSRRRLLNCSHCSGQILNV